MFIHFTYPCLATFSYLYRPIFRTFACSFFRPIGPSIFPSFICPFDSPQPFFLPTFCLSFYATFDCHFMLLFVCHLMLPLSVIVSYLCLSLSFYSTFSCHFILRFLALSFYLYLYRSFYPTFVCHCMIPLSVILSYLCLSLSFYPNFVCHFILPLFVFVILCYLCLSFYLTFVCHSILSIPFLSFYPTFACHFILPLFVFVILSYLCLSFYLTFVCHCHFISAYICPFIDFLKAVSSHPGLSFLSFCFFYFSCTRWELFSSHSLVIIYLSQRTVIKQYSFFSLARSVQSFS